MHFSPKIGCHDNAPLSLVYGSVTYQFPNSTNPIANQTLHGYGAYNRSCGHFVIYLLILAKNWLPCQRPLEPYNQKCLLWIARPRKPTVISNHILAISRTNAFICIYSNISPKIGCHGNAPLSVV